MDRISNYGERKTLLETVQDDAELQGRMYQTYRDYMIRKCAPRDIEDELMSFAQWRAHLGIVPVHMQYVTGE